MLDSSSSPFLILRNCQTPNITYYLMPEKEEGKVQILVQSLPRPTEATDGTYSLWTAYHEVSPVERTTDLTAEEFMRRWARVVPADEFEWREILEMDHTCPICTDSYSSPHRRPCRIQSETTNGKCQHVFCENCLAQYFHQNHSSNNLCPICRETWFTKAREDVLSEEVDALMRRAGAGTMHAADVMGYLIANIPVTL